MLSFIFIMLCACFNMCCSVLVLYCSPFVMSCIFCVICTVSDVENAEISPNFLVWKFCGNAQFPQNFGQFGQFKAFPQNSHTRKIGEISVFYAVVAYIYIWFYEWYFLLKRSTFFIKCYALFVTCCRSCAHYSIWCTYHVMCNFLLHLQSLLSDSIMCFDLYITVIPLTSTPSAYLISKRCAF